MSSLADLQTLIAETRARRGFTTDPLKLLALLTEEVGEVASEMKGSWSPNYREFSRDRLKEEIADVFVILTALASRYDIDLEQAVAEKFLEKDASRHWSTAAK